MNDQHVAVKWTRDTIERLVVGIDPEYFKSKRWFGSKSRTIEGYRVAELELLGTETDPWCYLVLELRYADSDPELYQLPLVFRPEEDVPQAIKLQPYGAAFVVPAPEGNLWAYDALADDGVCTFLYEAMRDDRDIQMQAGALVCRQVAGRMQGDGAERIRRIGTEQSNSSLVYDDSLILKAFRKLSAGQNPDFEVPYFLTTHTDFDYVPKVAGFMEYRAVEGEPISAGVIQEFLVNQGDGYTNVVDWVRDYFREVEEYVREHPSVSVQEQEHQAEHLTSTTQEHMRRLGFITGLMHNALDSSEDLPAFRPERITRADIENWNSGMTSSIREVIRDTRERADDLPRAQADLLRRIDEQETTFLGMVEGLDVLAQEDCYKTRTHGDYHLGQVLQTGDNYVILDFEGEPARTLAERRAKQCPLRDVAGMLRSFDYAAYGALFELWQVQQPEEGERETMEGWALLWEQLVSAAFMDGYHEAISRNTGPRFAPSDPAAFTRVVRIYEIDKAFYELKYEFNNRPAWIPIPVRGLLRALHTEG